MNWKTMTTPFLLTEKVQLKMVSEKFMHFSYVMQDEAEAALVQANKRQHMSDLNYDALEKALAQAREEGERLREALERIAARSTPATTFEVEAFNLAVIARQALSRSPQEKK